MGPPRVLSGLLVASALLAPACSAEVERTTAAFELSEVGSCRIQGLRDLALTVAGDFPSRSSEPVEPGFTLELDALPVEAEALSIDARLAAGHAAALAELPSGGVRAPLLLLPLDASCPLGDTLAAAPEGAAVASTPDGSLLITGGRLADGASIAGAVLLPRGALLASTVQSGPFERRAFASATTVERGVLLAGGAAGEDGPAHDNFEIFDRASGGFLPPQRLQGDARRNHGAARLPDGRVLLVGGVSEGAGRALASAELITPEDDDAQKLDATLNEARVEPSVLVLDDGRVLVLLGREGLDAESPAVLGVEELDLDADRFHHVADLPRHASAAVAALEGGRAIYLGCCEARVADEPGGCAAAAGCALALYVPDASGGAGFDAIADPIAPDVLDAAGLSGLSRLRLVALRDGKLLATGSVTGSELPARAFLIDLARGTVQLQDATRVPEHLVPLADGTLAEVDLAGTSLRRHDARSAFHDVTPEQLLSPDALVPDRPERVSFGGQHVRARDAARVDLSFLRFGRLHLELSLSGTGELLLEPEAAPSIAIELTMRRVALGSCAIERTEDAPIVVERHGEELVLRSGDAHQSCSVPGLRGTLGLALRLERDALVSSWTIERR